ncbi:MAG: GH32 C-terminal domain-containing protein, partial [Clostridia bacterium]|nr:GH32 C-terminal domain-containing protein [Clostridia bacterium]
GVRNIRRRNGMIDSFQTQCLAIGDGTDYEKLDLNPVIDATLLPEGGSEHDFRDPKIWREGDMFYAVIGNRCADGSGTILLYQSKDAINWEYVSILAACHNQYGRMWECPDFFPLDGKHVLLVSPQEMAAIGLEFHPGNANVCLIGKYDRKAHHLNREYVQAIDYGLDFYAPQTLLTEDGRRVMIAWMQNWETSSSKPSELRFMGQMTLPRELSVRNGRLFQNPVRELESCRGVKIDYHNVLINGEASLRGISGRCMDMTVTVRPGNERSIYKWFRLYVAKDGENFTMIRYRPDIGTLKVDRTHSGFPHDIVNIREFPVRQKDGEIKIRVVMDRYSMELFINDGEQAASFVLYTPQEANAVSFSSDGSVLVDVEKYDLEIR